MREASKQLGGYDAARLLLPPLERVSMCVVDLMQCVAHVQCIRAGLRPRDVPVQVSFLGSHLETHLTCIRLGSRVRVCKCPLNDRVQVFGFRFRFPRLAVLEICDILM